MAHILSIDTATEGCSVALLKGDQVIDRSVMDPQGHSRLVLEMIEEVLREGRVDQSDLDAISYDSGPGSFTGIRIGAGVAQGLSLGLAKPLLGICSLMVLAEEVPAQDHQDRPVLAAIDARMGQVYWGCLKRDRSASEGWRWLQEPCVSDPEAVADFSKGCVGLGSGWDRYGAVFQTRDETRWLKGRFPSADVQVSIARRLLESHRERAWQDHLPHYVRDQVASKS